MSKVLWIAEKKTLAEAIATALPGVVRAEGNAFVVGENVITWLQGHAFQQAMPDDYLPDSTPKTGSGSKVWRREDLPIFPNSWKIYPDPDKSKLLNRIERGLSQCDCVVHCGDPDEEGQLIVDELLHFYGNKKPVKRVLINDYNPTKVRISIEKARNNDDSIFRGWYLKALSRSHFDWLFGLNCTRAMTLRGRELGFTGILPVGSVQTRILSIVRERDRQIESFTKKPYFAICGSFLGSSSKVIASWIPKNDQRYLDDKNRLLNRDEANRIALSLKGSNASVSSFVQERKDKQAPLLYSANELAIECFKRFGYTAQEVLDACQKLYETYKVITYPRTEVRYVSSVHHLEAEEVIKAVLSIRPDLKTIHSLLDLSLKSASFDDSKVASSPHIAIIPTVTDGDINTEKWSSTEINVYDVVARLYLCQFAKTYGFLRKELTIVCNDETFVAKGHVPVQKGWKQVFSETEESSCDTDQVLTDFKVGDLLRCENASVLEKYTEPPDRFNRATLLDAMINIHRYVSDERAKRILKEGDGIGTSATRPKIIEDLFSRNLLILVSTKSKNIRTSEAARSLLDALPIEVKDPVQAGYTKATLDKVAEGKVSYEQFMAATKKWVGSIVNLSLTLQMDFSKAIEPKQARGADKIQRVCPKCRKGHLKLIDGKSGKFWGCSNYKEGCKATFKNNRNAPVFDLAKRANK